MRLSSLITENDPNNPEVEVVGGGGVLELNQIIRRVRDKVDYIEQAATYAKTAEDWDRVLRMIDDDWTHGAIETIIQTKRDIEHG